MVSVAGYEIALDRRYDPDSNLWVAELAGRDRVHIGYDPLGAEITGDIVAISFAPVGTALSRGDTLGTVEAAKFVGPLPAPVGGTLCAVNELVVAGPGSINADPLSAWLVELGDVDTADLDGLLGDEQVVTAWFAGAVERYRREGALAQ